MPVDNFPAAPNGVIIRKIADTRRVTRFSEVRRSERKIPLRNTSVWLRPSEVGTQSSKVKRISAIFELKEHPLPGKLIRTL